MGLDWMGWKVGGHAMGGVGLGLGPGMLELELDGVGWGGVGACMMGGARWIVLDGMGWDGIGPGMMVIIKGGRPLCVTQNKQKRSVLSNK